MLTLLRTPRWLAFTAAALVAIVAFGLLSLWQWHRAEQKRLEFAVVERALTAPPVPAAQLSDPADWQATTATGTYDAGEQYLVRNQPQDGGNGFWVVTLLTTGDSDLWVVRGWIPVDLGRGAAQQPPAPPSGPVTVAGYARVPSDQPLRAGADLPAGQISSVAVAALDAEAGVTTAPWFLVAERDPLLTPITRPEPTASRNLSYAGQWLLFAAIAVGGWFYFLRREAQETTDLPTSPVAVGSGR